MPMPLFIVALALRLLCELADSIGWPLTLLLVGAAIWGLVWLVVREPAHPAAEAAYVPPGPRCCHCQAKATYKSRDGLFLWCALCKGPDDKPLYGLDPRDYQTSAARSCIWPIH